MSGLSEVSVLFGKNVSDIEKAREVFTAEMRAFVTGILGGVRRVRSDPWTTPRVRLDLPREIETEAKSTGYLSSHFAVARANLRFKRGTNFMVVAEIRFGIEFDEPSDAFVWQIMLVPGSRYQRIDDTAWAAWRTQIGAQLPPGSAHQDKSNTVRFVARAIETSLTQEQAFNDVKQVFEFIVGADAALAEAIGLEASVAEETLVAEAT